MKLSQAIFGALNLANAQRDAWRLPTDLDPLNYNIQIKAFLDPDDQGKNEDLSTYPANTFQHFDATTSIKMNCTTATSQIVLNSLFLDFDESTTSLKKGNKDVGISSVYFDKDLEQVTIMLNEEIKENDEIDLMIEYKGYLQPNNFGFYISYYEDGGKRNYVASSQMQGPYARRVFPGFDEPGFKATYEITMEYQKSMPWSDLEYYPLSNMPYKSSADCTNTSGWCVQEFDKTVEMSSYLTAFAIVDFGSVNTVTSVEKTPANLYARQQLIGPKDQQMSSTPITNPMWFPAISTERTTDQFGKVLRSYSEMGVGKADQIALPDFNAGAMENWGLVTYREQSLLYDMNRDRFDRKFYVANVVSHEMAHMWFGDFVTCQFWDELWLNEAFATFISYVGLEENRDLETGKALDWDEDSSVGSWDLSRAFIANRYPAALQHDQTTSSNPIVNIENNNGKVDGHPKAGSSNIIYSKGGIILKNIRCFLGDEVFFGGLQNYLEEFKYSNPTTYDLTAAWENMRNEVGLDEESATKNKSLCDGIGFNPDSGVLLKGKTVGDHWDPWLRQMGYPFLTVKYTDENTKAGINIAQKRFLNNPDDDASKPSSSFDYKWPIPLQTAFKTGSDMKYMSTWIEEGDVNLESNIDFAIVNADYVSFFRTKYDGQILDDLVNVLSVDHKSVPSFTRANFVADYFAFAENKPLTSVDITDTLEYTSFMAEETDYVVWKMFDRAMSSVRGILKFTDNKDVLDGYLRQLVQKYYDQFGFSISLSNIADMDRESMNLALLLSCQYGNNDCLMKSKALIEKNDGTLANEPDRDQKLTAYCYGVQESSQTEWERLWASYKTEQNANELYSIRYGLACSKDDLTIKNWLQLIKGDDIRTQDKHTAINQVSGTETGRDLVWEFIESEWQWIKDKTLQESWTRASSILTTCTSTFSTSVLKQKVQSFRDSKKTDIKEMGLDGTFDNIMTTIDKNIKWREDNEQNFVDWIKNNENGEGGDAAKLTASAFFVLAASLL